MTTKQKWEFCLKIVFLVLLSYFCLRVFIPNWQALQLSDRLGTMSGPWILSAAIFTLGYYGLGFLTWTLILRNLGSQPDLKSTTRAYVLSLLPKYIPGNVAAHGLRTQLATRAGVPVFVSMKSFLLEAIFALGTAASISIPGTMYSFSAVIGRFFAWFVLALTLALFAMVAVRQFNFININKFSLAAPQKKSTSYINIFFLYLLLWSISGVAHWCLANALSSYSVETLPKLIVAVSAAWALGFVSIFAPAGLGVREAVLYFFVNDWMKQADAVLFVTLSRLLMFGVEVFLTVGFLLYSRLSHRAERAVPN